MMSFLIIDYKIIYGSFTRTGNDGRAEGARQSRGTAASTVLIHVAAILTIWWIGTVFCDKIIIAYKI